MGEREALGDRRRPRGTTDGPDRAPSASSALEPGADAPPAEPASSRSDSHLGALRPAGLLAGGAAAATASVIGGQLGVAGTVIGAFLTSVVSATALALYSDSVERSRRAMANLRGRSRSGITAGSSRTGSRSAAAGAASAAGEEDRAGAGPAAGRGAEGRSPRLRRIVLFSLVMATLAVLAVFGVQRVIGSELSPGTGTIQRSVTGTEHVAPAAPEHDRAPVGPEESPSTAPGDGEPSAPADSTPTPAPQPGEATPSAPDQNDGGDAPNDPAPTKPAPTQDPGGDPGPADGGGGQGGGVQGGGGQGGGVQGGSVPHSSVPTSSASQGGSTSQSGSAPLGTSAVDGASGSPQSGVGAAGTGTGTSR